MYYINTFLTIILLRLVMIKKYLEDIDNKEKLYKAFDEVNEIDIIDDKTDCISNKIILCKNFLLNILNIKKREFNSNKSEKLNLKQLLSKQIITGDKIAELLEKFPDTNRNIGKIPEVFFRRVAKKKHNACAIKLYDIFAKYSLILNYDYTCDIEDDDYIECRDQELAKELTKLLRQKVSVKYTGHGCNGNGFKISLNNQNYFYKVFYLHNKPDKISIEKHGSNAEIPFAYFANKKGRKGQFAKFYFGRLASKYEKDCFMITEYLEKQEGKNTEKLHIDYITINPDEYRRSDNKINGKIVDFGGLIESDIEELKDPAIRKLIRIILKHINYQFDSKIFEARWEINKPNLDSLKKYIFSKSDYRLYLRAVEIIKASFHNIPEAIINTLNNLKNETIPIEIIDTLLPSHIITPTLETLQKNLYHYNIKIKTRQNAQSEMLGYLIIDLNYNRHAIARFDTENNIQELRFEQVNDGKINIILKLTSQEILKSELKDFSGILY